MSKRKGYIFTNKRHSNRGIMSVILGIISLAALVTAVFFSYLSGGEAAVKYGFTGVLAMVFSLVGVALGVLTACDKSYYRFFPVLGVILNVIDLGGVSLILYAGVNL
ncbi:MAG: DUF6142 family protein [Firmicutes bacterium]|nr:DUF6142 family protein [Bacillota bacterium]